MALAFIRWHWRENNLRQAHVETIPANFGTAGSLADYRRRRTDVVVAPPEPRLRAFNGLIPLGWRLRVLDDAKVSAVASHAQQPAGQSVSFKSPRTASLLSGEGKGLK